MQGFQGTSHISSISIVNIFSFYTSYIVNKIKKKVRRFSEKDFVDFDNLMEIKFCWRLIFEILIIHKPSLGSCDVTHKIWARSVQLFFVYWIQTNRQAKYIYSIWYI